MYLDKVRQIFSLWCASHHVQNGIEAPPVKFPGHFQDPGAALPLPFHPDEQKIAR